MSVIVPRVSGLGRRREAGLTLIELMIAVTVALVLLAALAAMYGTQIRTRNEIERSQRQIENGRYALQVLRDEIQLAGYYGELNLRNLVVVPTPGAVPDVCVTHRDAPGDLPADGVASDLDGDGDVDGLDYLTAVLPLHVQGFNLDGGTAAPSCLTDVRAGTDIVVVRRALTCVAGAANCPFMANAPYVQASMCDTEIKAGQLFLLRADGNLSQFVLRTLACDAAALTPIRRMITHIYYIANNNVSGDGVPTLKRRELVSAGFTTTALVEGIEDMQFQYGVDAVPAGPPTGDGVPETYVDQPADAQAWRNAMTARVYLLSRSTEPRTGYVDGNTYTLGSKNIAAPNDAFRRQVFETLVPLRNAAVRRQ